MQTKTKRPKWISMVEATRLSGLSRNQLNHARFTGKLKVDAEVLPGGVMPRVKVSLADLERLVGRELLSVSEPQGEAQPDVVQTA